MRILLIVAAVAGLTLAQESEAQEQTVQDGKLTDPIWKLTFEAPKLAKGMAVGGPAMLFEGRCDGGITIEIKVREAPVLWSAPEWRKEIHAAWEKQGRKRTEPENGDEPGPWSLFVEESLAGSKRHHGYMWYARGNQCFEVHAQVNEKTETSGDAIKAVLKNLKLGEDPGLGLLVAIVARRMGDPIDHPVVLLKAAGAYIRNQPPNYPMARKILKTCRQKDKGATYEPEERYMLYAWGGHALLSEPDRDAAQSIAWNKQAEQIAKEIGTPQFHASGSVCAYNLACAYSLMDDMDKAFAALRRSHGYTAKVPVEDAWILTGDTDLANMRKQTERWEAFLKERGSLFKPK